MWHREGKVVTLFYVQTLWQKLFKQQKRAGLPVSVKTRRGFKELNEWEDLLTNIFKQGIANLSIYLRIREGMSQVDAH